MDAKYSLCRRTIPEILKPEGAAVEWRLIAWGWMVRRVLLQLVWIFPLFVFSGCVDFQSLAKHYDDALTKEKIGILAHTDITWANSTAPLKRALAFFRQEDVDRVVFLGDPTKDGYKHQLEVFDAAWTAAFKGAKPPERILADYTYRIGDVDFSGYGRIPLTDLVGVYPFNGKVINAGSMRGFELSSSFRQWNKEQESAAANSAQGLLVLVRSDGLKVRRMDFSGKTAEDVGEPWIVQDGLIHAAGAKAPEFWPDTRLSIVRGYASNGEPIYTLRWPPVLAKYTGERAFSYTVAVDGRTICQVQSKGFFLPESRDAAAVLCVVTEKELEGAPPEFSVTPVSSLAQSGRAITAE